jgi:hypothetical protein
VATALAAALLIAAGIGASVPGQAAVLDGLELTSAISNQGIANPGSSLTVTVHLANNSGGEVAPTSVSVTAADVDVSTVTGLEDWLATTTGGRGTTLGSRLITGDRKSVV